jgi:hypothetical protein
MKIGSGIVIGKDDAAGASAVRKPPEDRRRRPSNPNPKLVRSSWFTTCNVTCNISRYLARILNALSHVHALYMYVLTYCDIYSYLGDCMFVAHAVAWVLTHFYNTDS